MYFIQITGTTARAFSAEDLCRAIERHARRPRLAMTHFYPVEFIFGAGSGVYDLNFAAIDIDTADRFSGILKCFELARCFLSDVCRRHVRPNLIAIEFAHLWVNVLRGPCKVLMRLSPGATGSFQQANGMLYRIF